MVCSAGERLFVLLSLQTLQYILWLLKEEGIEHVLTSRQCLRLISHDVFSGHRRQSLVSLTSPNSLPWKGPFLGGRICQPFYLLLFDGKITSHCEFVLMILPAKWQLIFLGLELHARNRDQICYWSWKSLKTFFQSRIHFISVDSLSDTYQTCKSQITSAAHDIYCWKIPRSIILVTYTSVELLSVTCLLHLPLTLILHIQQILPHVLPHCITMTWKIPLYFHVQFQTVCILLVIVLLCSQLGMVVVHRTRTVHATSSGTAIVFLVMCSLFLCHAHPTSREPNPATYHNSGVLRHTRESAMTSATLTLRLTGGPNVGYCARVAMGSVPQELCMLVDTGSANFAVAGSRQDGIDDWFHTASSSTYMEMGTSITVRYTSGEWSGTLSKDMVSLGNTAQFEVHFAVIDSSENFFIDQATWVGILGLGYSSLVKPDSSIPTVWDTFRSQTGMHDVFSLQLCPPLDILVTGGTGLQGGWMVLGGVNHSMYDGDIFNTSIVEEKFYNVIITNLTVGNARINMDCAEFNNDKAIIDSGTTDIFLPERVYKKVEAAFKAYFADGFPLEVPDTFWGGRSKLMWQAQHKDEIFNSFPTFHIGFSSDEDSTEGFSLAITPQTYLRQISGTSSEISTTNITCYPCDFFTFGIKPRKQGTVIGSNMMLGFYTIFDRKNRKMGFARSKCSYRSENSVLPYIEGPYSRDPVDCHYKSHDQDWEQISFICAGIALPMGMITLIVALCLRCRSRLGRLCKGKHYEVLNNAEENNRLKNVDQEVASAQTESSTSEATNVTTAASETTNRETVISAVDEGVHAEDGGVEFQELVPGLTHNNKGEESPTDDEGYYSLPNCSRMSYNYIHNISVHSAPL